MGKFFEKNFDKANRRSEADGASRGELKNSSAKASAAVFYLCPVVRRTELLEGQILSQFLRNA